MDKYIVVDEVGTQYTVPCDYGYCAGYIARNYLYVNGKNLNIIKERN